MNKHTIPLPLLILAALAVIMYVDPAFAQNFNQNSGGQQATFTTGLGRGVDGVLGTVVNAARVLGLAGGLIQGVKAGYDYTKGERDAMETLKGVGIGLVIIAAGFGIAQAIVATAGQN